MSDGFYRAPAEIVRAWRIKKTLEDSPKWLVYHDWIDIDTYVGNKCVVHAGSDTLHGLVGNWLVLNSRFNVSIEEDSFFSQHYAPTNRRGGWGERD